MLTLTDNATNVIKTLAGGDQAPDGAGLRISQSDPQSPDLAVTTATAPEPNDQVVEEQGARVYLEPQAAVTLDDKVLDAQIDPSGGVQFTLGQQGGAPVDGTGPQ